MIKIVRTEEPSKLSAGGFEQNKRKLFKYFRKTSENRAQQKFSYEDISFNENMALDVANAFNHKCAWCESSLDIKNAISQLDYFRPRRDAKGLNNEFAPDHYWWLSYEWGNIYYACQDCMRFRESWFPVKGKRSAIKTPYRRIIEEEENLLIDPCHEYPEEHIKYSMEGDILPLTDKGEITIDLFKLNRPNLKKARLDAIVKTIEITEVFEKSAAAKRIALEKASVAIANLYEHLVKLTVDESEPYLGFHRWYLSEWIDKQFSLDLFLVGEEEMAMMDTNQVFLTVLRGYRSRLAASFDKIRNSYRAVLKKRQKRNRDLISGISNFYIEKVEVKNFRAIDSIIVRFPEPLADKYQEEGEIKHHEPWLMLLGENGVGKTTFLQALALTLMGSVKLKKMKIKCSQLLRHGTKEGHVSIFVYGYDMPLSLFFSVDDTYPHCTIIRPPSFLLGYGPLRMMPWGLLRPESVRGKVKVMNLFNPDVSLCDPCKWIVNLYTGSRRSKTKLKLFNRVGLAIKDLLLLKKTERLVVEKGEAMIRYSKTRADLLEELSEGYKSVIALVVDIMQVLVHSDVSMESAKGIILIDEIGTHLHPRWRMQVVKRFRDVFPKLQFIVTTHDPLCLRGLKKGEISVFDKDNRGRIFVLTDLPDSSEYRVDQLLTSAFFGLNSVIDPELEKLFNEYYGLLRKAKPTQKEMERIEKLRVDLEPRTHLGSSFREELMYKAVDEVIARSNITTPGLAIVSPKAQDKQNDSNHKEINISKITDEAEEEVRARTRELWHQKVKQ